MQETTGPSARNRHVSSAAAVAIRARDAGARLAGPVGPADRAVGEARARVLADGCPGRAADGADVAGVGRRASAPAAFVVAEPSDAEDVRAASCPVGLIASRYAARNTRRARRDARLAGLDRPAGDLRNARRPVGTAVVSRASHAF